MYAVHPRPPSPRGAAGPRNRGLCGLPCAAVFGLGSRSPRQAMGRTQRNEGEEKSQSFGNLGHSEILPEIQEHCCFELVEKS